MILYHNKAGTLRLLMNMKGSVFIDLAVPATWTLVVTMLINTLDREFIQQYMSVRHPFSLQVYLFLIGFQTIFRTNMAHWRFWEARTQVNMMIARWMQSFLQTKAFMMARVACFKGTAEERLNFAAKMREALERQATYFTVLNAVALNSLSEMKTTDDPSQWDQLEHTFRPKDPHRCRVVETFNEPRFERVPYVQKLAIVGKPSRRDCDIIMGTHDKVLMVMMWITEELSNLVMSDKLTVPAPIVSRPYQELSNGSLGYEQALKIALVPFPFVFHQVSKVSMLILLISAPPFSCFFTESRILAPILAVLVIVGYLGLHHTSLQLEEPYGQDANDQPLFDLQFDFCAFVRQTLETDLPGEQRLGLGRYPKQKIVEVKKDELNARGNVKRKSGTRMSMGELGLDGADASRGMAEMAVFSDDEDENLIVEAEAHPIVQNLNKKLREQEQTVFPTWLDPELLPDYDISHLTKKFKDPDVATWVYRLIREEFPGRLPPRGNSGGGLIAELEEAKKENFELESKVTALEDETASLERELKNAREGAVESSEGVLPPNWHTARDTTQDLEYRKEISELDSEVARLRSSLDVARMKARHYTPEAELEPVEEEVITLVKDKCRIERNLTRISKAHVEATENLEKSMREQMRIQKDAIAEAQLEFMALNNKFEAELEEQEKRHGEELELVRVEEKGRQEREAKDEATRAKQEKADRTKKLVGQLQQLSQGYANESLSNVIHTSMEAKVKRSARQARRAAKKKAEQPASAWQEAGSEPQSPSGNGRDPPSPNGGDEILDIEEIDGDQEIPSLEELTRLGQEHLLEEP
jgi:predicted membrane chloride channel (bestrophin family)